jgi:hypothetical protein
MSFVVPVKGLDGIALRFRQWNVTKIQTQIEAEGVSTFTVRRSNGNSRDIEITLVRLEPADDPAQGVTCMLDHAGHETFDPMAATEVIIEGALVKLQEGDRITMRVDINQ